ncbi:hypothetical protein H6G76_34840 [Nostoc sp. FACHB-152]|uniref:hypothetical protein n=1 Tax=unclassified Nostoc TaxID=2593658 RepID=UPI001683E812|nr:MULTISPECIES: hypothetical protein [unclassified Nostoc]MBD2452192.1 hypothetical protein [Nostoc sp. FACHB-152]MBD2473250.1 hypothetical protein [Nostoc sp. FACHB-145]
MTFDNSDWIYPIDSAPLVWSQLLNTLDLIAPLLCAKLKDEYEQGLEDTSNESKTVVARKSFTKPRWGGCRGRKSIEQPASSEARLLQNACALRGQNPLPTPSPHPIPYTLFNYTAFAKLL